LVPILRGRAPRLLPAARDGLGDRFGDAFYAAWHTPIWLHPDDPSLRDALDQLDGAAMSADPATAAELHRAQSVALRLAGRAEAAARAAERSVAAARAAEPRQLAAALRALALVTPDADVAFAALDEALAVHPAPETLADALTAEPLLRRLHDDPRWAAVAAARAVTAGE
jgi:hypothetical protein